MCSKKIESVKFWKIFYYITELMHILFFLLAQLVHLAPAPWNLTDLLSAESGQIS